MGYDNCIVCIFSALLAYKGGGVGVGGDRYGGNGACDAQKKWPKHIKKLLNVWAVKNLRLVWALWVAIFGRNFFCYILDKKTAAIATGAIYFTTILNIGK